MIALLLVLAGMHGPVKTRDANHKVCLFEEESSCETCTMRSDAASSRTLSGRNLTVQFCSSEFHLEYVLTIAHSHNVRVKGMPSQLICNHLNTGIHIFEVTGLVLQDVELVSCGNIYTAPYNKETESPEVKFISSIYILNCMDITVEGITVVGSKGNGLSMFDNNGDVQIHDSQFKLNIDNRSSHGDLKPGGSGLHVVLSYCRPRSVSGNYSCSTGTGRDITRSNYRIENCHFSKNIGGSSSVGHESNPFSEERQLLASGFGRGGGLCIVIDKNSAFNSVQITHCKFLENSAMWGGGLYISVLQNAQENNISVTDCVFYKNKCLQLAGGGANVGFQVYHDNHPQGNSIEFLNCRFTKNKAVFGGGVSFYSSSSSNLTNKMVFRKCNWSNNIADIGAAVNIAPQVWKAYIYDLKIKIIFRDCTIAFNYVSNLRSIHLNTSYKKGRGTFSAVGYRIWFEGRNVFNSNKNSAMYLTSTEIELCAYSDTVFINNEGFDGGAIYMLGFSSIIVNDNANVTFVNNSALTAGGAIFQHTHDTRDFFASQSCFIRYNGGTSMDYRTRNITFLFQNNVAGQDGRNTEVLGQFGHSIYATTIEPCYNLKGCKLELYDRNFTCIGKFTFKDEMSYDISTAVKKIRLVKGMLLDESNKAIWIIPGNLTELPIEAINDLSVRVSSIYHVSVTNTKESNVFISSAYTYLSDKSIIFGGRPGDKANITLETVERTIMFRLPIQLQECPPGYIHNQEKGICECSVYTNRQFLGIRTCDEKKFQALLTQGTWMGYSLSNNNTTCQFGLDRYLLHSTCPLGQCINKDSKQNQSRLLPGTTSIKALDEAVCGKSRTGVLCSKCRDGYAPHYHHSTHACKEGVESCKFGWLLYIVSEIIPVTIFFIVVMVFDIKFTDGAVSGFILFVQLSDTMLIKANGFIQLPDHVLIALDVYRFITRIFNLNFFAIDGLSFCLWRKASTLDLLAFKYITILYALTLVVLIIAIFKYCRSKCFNKMLMRMNGGSAASTKSNIIHGVSGFLVICYSECTRISLLLLMRTQLYAGNDTGNYVKHTVAFYNGEFFFFRGKHLFYALPALVIVFILGILPPLLLISYPLCYRVLTFLKISETRGVKLLCTCVPLEKFKPFFDSFQSSYRDGHRFFSGLYFLYRFTTLAAFAFMSYLNTYYILVQVQLAIILTVHAICQPHKKHWHNVLDALLFVNLSLINTATLFNFSLTLNLRSNQKYINQASTVQVILLYMPLLYIIGYSIWKRFHAAKHSEVMSALCYKLKLRKKASFDCTTDYRELSSSFSLNAVENRLKDNVEF